jgi:hypothetical protein
VLALAGAVIGFALGLVLDSLIDPSRSRGNEAFEEGYRRGFILRYVSLGAIAFVLADGLVGRMRRGGSPADRPVLAFAAGLVLVCALAIVPPLTTEGSPEEREGEQFRAGFLDGCTKNRNAVQAGPEEVARRYCTCLLDALARDRDQQELERFLREANRAIRSGRAPPRPFVRAAAGCA